MSSCRSCEPTKMGEVMSETTTFCVWIDNVRKVGTGADALCVTFDLIPLTTLILRTVMVTRNTRMIVVIWKQIVDK